MTYWNKTYGRGGKEFRWDSELEHDEKLRKKVDAKNGLENYCFQMKNTLTDEKVKDKFTDEDKTVIEDTVKDGLQFLEGNADAAAEEYEAKQKELEGKFNPIMMRVYQAAGGQPGAGGMPDMGGMGGGMPPGGMPGGMGGGMPTGGAPDAGVDDLD